MGKVIRLLGDDGVTANILHDCNASVMHTTRMVEYGFHATIRSKG